MSVLDSIGDYSACARMCFVPRPPVHAVNRGLAMEGLMSVLAGAIGCGHATTSYGSSIGTLGVTKVKENKRALSDITLFIYLCFCFFVCLPGYLFVCLFVCLFTVVFACFIVYLFVHLLINLFVCLPGYLFDCLFICLFLFVYLGICLSDRLFICLFTGVFICLFVYLFIYLRRNEDTLLFRVL